MTRKQWKGMGWYAIKGDSYVYLGKGSLQEATDKLIALIKELVYEAGMR